MSLVRPSNIPVVSDEYARAFENGALAACDYIAEQWPDLAEGYDDNLSVTDATAEHIGGIIDVMLGRAHA